MRHLNALFAGSCLVALAAAGAANAQPAAAAGSAQTSAAAASGSNPIEEVVVTATRQTSTVNKVAMSIAAVTQKSLDEQGLRETTDLSRVVPQLTITGQATGVATFGVRGIVASTGAATTGVYIDDTNITKRNNAGVSQNNGAPLPILFDLDRVEVLKGPQGTLYGGSSEGGTVRFITPTPSLTTYSGIGRAGISEIENGSPSNEFGVAVGGPVIQDKVGVRLSLVERTTGGWITVEDPYPNGAQGPGGIVQKNANGRSEWAGRGTALWQVTPDFSVTAQAYHSEFDYMGGPDSSTLVYSPTGQVNFGQVYTTPAACYNTATYKNGTTPAAIACPASALPGQTVNGVYMRPQASYGPFNYIGKNDSISPSNGIIFPTSTFTNVDNITMNYNFPGVSVKSITSYLGDQTTGYGGEGNDPSRQQTTLQNPGKTSFPLFSLLPSYSGEFLSRNHREGIEEELRISSNGDPKPFSWVAGMFYSLTRTHIRYDIVGDYDATDLAFFGLTAAQRYGWPNQQINGVNETAVLNAHLTDGELAGFGEANYWVTSKLKLTAGVRVSRVTLDYGQSNSGQLDNSPLDPSNASSTYIHGSSNDLPVTPKGAIEYDLNDHDLLYLSAEKGFRAGGVNVPLNPITCASGLALYGLTVADIPKTYGPDSVWSYELGGKFRILDNKMQLNLAAYEIDWSQIQVTTAAQGCGQNWNQNGGTATSRGFDLQTEYRPIPQLAINLQLGYDNAFYTAPVLGPKPLSGTQAVTYLKGDPLGVPDWVGAVGARYSFQVLNRDAYVRADWQYQASYLQGSGPGTGNYNPFTRSVPENDQLNMRAGLQMNGWDVNIFSNNILDSRQRVGNAGNGIGGCSATAGVVSACSTYSLFNPLVQQTYQRPREVGVQANYRF
jgi:iron complex outermembrane receptor protein